MFTRYAGILIVLIGLALLLTGRLIYIYFADPIRFPIKTVKVTASYEHVQQKDLEQVLTDHLRTSFFTFSIKKLKDDLNAFEWADDVQIQRIWPDTLKVVLIEKVPIAIWNNAMLTAQGEIFNEGKEIDLSLPHLNGPLGQEKEVLQVYKKISKILLMYGLHAESLTCRDNQAWELVLANGIKLHLGKREITKRLTRFCKVYPYVFSGKTNRLANVDLRYPRGMAVQWNKLAEK